MESTENETRPARGPPQARTGFTMANGLVALLAAAALAVALLVPGPAGPGTLMAQNSRGGPMTIGAACTHYAGAEVTIAVPGPGTVVVSATVGVGVNHSFGTNDEARIVVAASDTECAITNHTAFVSVPQTLPTDPFHFQTVPVLRPFAVAAGSHTFYVNGVMASGADVNDRFDSASLVAVFYPA